MPTLVNFTAEDELYHGKLFRPKPVTSDHLLSRPAPVDLYCPPHKKLRISSPYELLGSEKSELEKKKSSIESLPTECLFEIFRRLSVRERSACAGVSKRWLLVLSTICNSELCASKPQQGSRMVSSDDFEEADDGFLTRCLEGKKATDLRLLAISVVIPARGGLGKLFIRGSNSSRGVTDLGLSAIARGCPSLRTLSLWNVSSFGDQGVCEIANGCRELEKIEFQHCPSITDRVLIAVAENCPNLTSLTVESCPLVGNDSLQAIGRHCLKFESISIKGCPLISGWGIVRLLSSPSAALSKLRLTGLNIGDFALAAVGNYGKSILSLSLSNLKNVSEKGFCKMGAALGLHSLLSLTINSCLGLTDSGLEAIAKGSPVLKQISLVRCFSVSDNGLLAFYRSASCIESLHLEQINRVTLSGIISALYNCGSKLKSLSLVNCMGMKDIVSKDLSAAPCRSLRSLSVQNCLGFSSAGLSVLGSMCPRIRCIDLTGSHWITDEGLLPFLQSGEVRLVEVILKGCQKLSDKAVVALTTLHGKTLEVLNLESCRKITDFSLEAVAQSCTALNDLDLSFCAITDLGIAALSSAEQLSLKILSLSSCSGITNKCVPYLIEIGDGLVGLSLIQCHLISSSAIDQLIDSLWRCDILS